MSRIPDDYEERVYAGVLGKIIGVYLGRPFEGWAHEQIVKELGEIRYYVHELLNKPLIVVDDDISGTFTFLRAMPDYGHPQELSPAQIGQTWLNYLIENKTVLWWRFYSAQWKGRCRADRRPDLYRRMGDDRAGRPGACGRARPTRGQRQPRWRGRLWRAGDRSDGGRGFC